MLVWGALVEMLKYALMGLHPHAELSYKVNHHLAVYPEAVASCYVNLQEKKKTLPLSGTSYRLLQLSLCTEPSMRTPHQQSQASRLNHLLFEVAAVATPQVAYSFVTKRCPALHTFDRADRVAGTRRATKSQSSRCSCLRENASIREEHFRNPSYPFVAGSL